MIRKMVLLLCVAFNQSTMAACNDRPAPAVNWSGCDKSGQDFSSLNMQGAIFTRANLQGANFTAAKLNNVDLDSANISQAKFTKAIMMDARMVSVMAMQTDFKYGHSNASLKWNHYFSPKTSLEVVGAYSNYKTNTLSPDSVNNIDLKNYIEYKNLIVCLPVL